MQDYNITEKYNAFLLVAQRWVVTMGSEIKIEVHLHPDQKQAVFATSGEPLPWKGAVSLSPK